MTVKLKKKVKVRTAKTKAPKKKKKYYFGKEAHNAIVEYQNEKENSEKNKIYIEKIKPSFEKLTENLIFIHGFASCNTTFHILKSDCVSFLFETLQKFDSSKGSKAFSYFNFCAKHFLIIQQKKKNKRNSRHISLHDQNLSVEDKSQIENHIVEKCQEMQMIHKEDKELIKEMLKLIESKTNNINEKKCIGAIATLFNKIEDLDYLNKRAVFVYLRELSGLNAKQLSVAMSNLRKYYRDITNNDLFMFFAE